AVAPSAGDERGGDGEQALAAAGEAEPVRRRRRQAHGRPEGAGHRLSRLLAAAADPRAVPHDLDGDVADLEAGLADEGRGGGEELGAGRPGPAGVGGAEAGAEVTQAGR